MITFDRLRRRVWIAGYRVHHGLAGAVLVVMGAWLAWSDRHDFPWLPARHV